MIRWLQRLLGDRLPHGFTGALANDEQVLAIAETTSGPLVATTLGLWVPSDATSRLVNWHMISKAEWGENALSIVEGEEISRAGEAVLIKDAEPMRFRIAAASKLPRVVRERVEASIRSKYHKNLPGGGAWFVQRRVPGVDGVLLQARVEPGTDREIVAGIAQEAAERLANPHE